MNLGDAFLLNVEPPQHLWVVIAKASDDLVFVNLTTRPSPSPDDSCVIRPGEHPFVVRDTIVNYRLGRMGAEADLDSARNDGYIEMRESVSDDLLLRIQEGALVSPHPSQKIQAAVRAQLGR